MSKRTANDADKNISGNVSTQETNTTPAEVVASGEAAPPLKRARHDNETEGDANTTDETKESASKTLSTTPKNTADASTNASDTASGGGAVASNAVASDMVRHHPKRPVALCVGYVGTDFRGSQINPGVPTIEQAVLDALFQAGALLRTNYEQPGKSKFHRCSRTDKGVHAAGNVLGLKMMLSPSVLDDTNAFLPESVRILGVQRVTKSFNAQHQCDSRTYEFYIPTFVFQKPTPAENDSEKFGAYRVNADTMRRFRSIMSRFQGTHKFHNFSSGKDAKEMSAQRFIMHTSVKDARVLDDGFEWMVCVLKGQSFLLNQIRKMTGTAIQMVRDNTDEAELDRFFGKEPVSLPMTPPIGLLLVACDYTHYNSRFPESAVEFAELDALKEFKRDKILPEIVRLESENHDYKEWCRALDRHRLGIPQAEKRRQLQLRRQREAEKKEASAQTSANADGDTKSDATTTEAAAQSESPEKVEEAAA